MLSGCRPFFLNLRADMTPIWIAKMPAAAVRLAGAFALVLLAFGGSARPQTTAAQPTLEAIATQARQAQQSGRSEEAIRLYQQGVRMQPAWAEGWWRLGTLYYSSDRPTPARDAFIKLAYLKQQSGAAWAMLGLCEFSLKDYDRALVNLEHGHSLGLNDNPELQRITRFHIAILVNRAGQPELALQTLNALAQSVQQADPVMIEALGLVGLEIPALPGGAPPQLKGAIMKCGLAQFHFAHRETQAADKAFRELVAQFPRTPGVHHAAGAFMLSSDRELAVKYFKQELEVSPKHVKARVQLAFYYITAGEYATALPYADEAVKLAPGFFVARNALGQILIELDQINRAVSELETAVKLQPGSPHAHFQLARAYTRAGRNADAARERAEFTRIEKSRKLEK
jgi:tetratricopeptide (TPR) repeat protein